MTATAKSLGEWRFPSVWAQAHRTIGGKRLKFYSYRDLRAHRPWSVAILDDMHRRIVVKKARQLGVTEIMMGMKLLYTALMVPTTTIYTMPIWSKAREHARDRFDVLGKKSSMSRLSDQMLSRIADWRSVLTKKFYPRFGGGVSTVMFTGSGNETLGESTAADVLYFDEFDKMSQFVIAAFEKSLGASSFGHVRKFSTPTFPNHGVSAVYEQSDKKVWMYKCPRCGKWQYLTLDNIAQRSGPMSLMQRLENHDPSASVPDGTFDYVCIKCRRSFNRQKAKAHWVAEKNHTCEYSGYYISQLDAVWITPDALMRDMRDLKPGKRPFYNYDLGLEYLGDSGGVVEGWLYTLINPSIPSINSAKHYISHYKNFKTYIGIDWGKTNWAIVLATSDDWSVPMLVWAEQFNDTRDPDDTIAWALGLARRWGASAVVADAGFGADRNPKLHDALRAKFFACQYITSRRESRNPATCEPSFGPNPPSPKDATAVVTVDRTGSLKVILSKLQKKAFGVVHLGDAVLTEVDRHFGNIVIIVDVDRNGVPFEEAKELGDDHYLHAMNYADIAYKWATSRPIRVASDDPATEQEYRDLMNQFDNGMLTGEDIQQMYDLFPDLTF